MDAAAESLVPWLLETGEPSLEYRVRRDLLGAGEAELGPLRRAIAERGWARRIMDARDPGGHWGKDAYCPKWTCTHYALWELAQLGMPPGDERCRESCGLLLGYPEGADGGVNYAHTVEYSDVCVNGVLLAVACHFEADRVDPAFRERIDGILDYLLRVRLPDGGWNCEYRGGSTRGSLHTSVGVLEGLWAYRRRGFRRRGAEAASAIASGVEFILRHELFRSERTGEVIKDEFLRLCFPVRWKYDVLRCLEGFAENGVPADPRMGPALDAVEAARGKDGRWKARSQPGKVYVALEREGAPGRWNTLRALRVLRAYGRA